MLNFLYNTIFGRAILKLLIHPSISIWCGRFLDSRFSRFLIGPFVKKNGIDLSEFYADDFTCFNECFYRKIRRGRRPIDMTAGDLISPCDGLLSVYDIAGDKVIPVKQSHYRIADLLKDEELAKGYEGGLCLVYRLCVNHYHRYCYFDSGRKSANRYIPGVLHTVRPIALRSVPVFAENSREYTIINTDNFGTAVQMEVGAMLVGRIVNLHEECSVVRGDEKGHFEYGGSTIIVLLEKNVATIDERIRKTTAKGHEVPVVMGQKIGIGV